mmetsp:Transcript_30602/g.46962  ORF Transcript_30602/g.46962 Transcript_30602/m.46962 type:complete len:145 (-) Transcript_30602:1030-1464(-)
MELVIFLNLRNSSLLAEPIPLGTFSFTVLPWLPKVSSLPTKVLLLSSSRAELQLTLENELDDEITLESVWLTSPRWPAYKVIVEGTTVSATFLEGNQPSTHDESEPWSVSCSFSWKSAESSSLSLGLEIYVTTAPELSEVRFLQ